MKKIIKNFVIIGCVGLFLTGCTLFDTSKKQNNEETTETKTYENMDKIESVIDTTEVTEFAYEDFTINIVNADVAVLNKDVIDDLIQYTVYANVKTTKYDIAVNYQGVNMFDLAEILVPKEYTKVVFSGNGYSVTVPKTDLVNSFLIFQSDGKNLEEWGPAKIFLSTYSSETWIESISTIEFK